MKAFITTFWLLFVSTETLAQYQDRYQEVISVGARGFLDAIGPLLVGIAVLFVVAVIAMLSLPPN